MIPDLAPDGESILSILGKRTYSFSHGEAASPQDYKNIDYYKADEHYVQGNSAA